MATSADMIPLSDLKRRYQVHAQALQEICSSAMAQHPHMQGELQKDFEIRFAKYIGRKHAVLVDSGTTALRLAFRVFSETDESIRVCDSSVFSYVASASQPIDLGFKLRFHDVDENALWQPAEIDDDAVTLLIHMHGKMVAPNPNYSKEHIIEDAAQGLGSVRDGVKAGALGRMSCFSFAHNKTIHGYANAGIVVTDSDTDFERLKSLRFHGREGANYTRISGNHNVGSVTAGVLTYFLNRVDQDIERRESIAKFYREQFSELPLTLQSVEPGETHNWHKFVVHFENQEKRDQVLVALKKKNIEVKINYPQLLNEISAVNGAWKLSGSCEKAKSLCQITLTLPNQQELTDAEVETVASEVRALF